MCTMHFYILVHCGAEPLLIPTGCNDDAMQALINQLALQNIANNSNAYITHKYMYTHYTQIQIHVHNKGCTKTHYIWKPTKKIGKIKDLGKDGAIKADEFSETIQTAFDPPPHFRKIVLQFFLHQAGL